ncbi:universal stress protein [Mycolicibacterium fluoranthenivorans]|uniref:Nucleotide-binding universal stress protein, UspA family n=1 Tax=Mycolicibacterium fluoranthenivorans TaxID=258505 RepID=A0A1G4WSM2_9MYCO|nr:universal stress protein [Mycolicibacterium fluoranthenivorans]SCX27902.1 Nucleotide-binding universal stress protein, UspA family [Mycolicibacterium fluoranthenivorans]
MSSATAPHNGILVAVDGSGCSDDAVRWAAAEAVLRRQKLSIVNIVSPLTDGWYGAGMFGSPITAEFGAWQQDEADKIIADAVRIARDSVDGADLDISTEVPSTAVVPTLIDFSKQAAMIVLGSRGMGAVGRLLLGSVSTALVHHAHCPVAIIRGPLSEGQTHGPVVVGIDGSPASERATAVAFEEASLRHAELVALHAFSNTEWPEVMPLPWSAFAAEAGERLAERLAGWQERYPDVVVQRVVVRDQPVQNLLAQAESAQLVIVGSHGRGGFAGMLLGSVSSAVVHQIHSPVIVARHD